jgi:hypothetical protein
MYERIPKLLRYVNSITFAMTLSLIVRTSAGEAASNSRCKRRTIRKRLKRQKRRAGKLPVGLVKFAKIAISPVRGKGLAEFEVAFTNP